MTSDSDIDLYNWKVNSDLLLLDILLQEEKFRKKICCKCSIKMRSERKCEVYKDGKTFCNALVRARERNEKLKKRKKDILFLSPSLNKSSVLSKMAQTLY